MHAASLAARFATTAAELVRDTVASRIGDADPSVWGPAAADGLGWVGLPRTSRPLVGQITALREQFRVAGASRVLLVAAPGLAAGAEAIARAEGVALTVLDTTDPGQVGDALAGDLAGSVLVLADPAGDRGGPADAVARVLAEGMAAEGIDPAQRTVVITEPGSALDEWARGVGATVVTTEPDVPACFAALGALGLVPAGLAGADVGQVLADATAAAELVAADDPENPALVLAAALATADGPLTLDADSGPDGLAEWVEQLVAGSSAGRGPLPVLVEGTGAPDWPGPGIATALGPPGPRAAGPTAQLTTRGPLGAQFVLWQFAVAAAGRLLDVDPFGGDPFRGDPAPVEPPEAAAAQPDEPTFVDGAVQVHAGDWLPAGVSSVAQALRALVDRAPDGGHLVLTAWLDRFDDASAAVLRAELARRTGLTTTFGWSPRDRAGAARYHREAPDPGVFCQLTGESEEDLPVPGDDDGLARRGLAAAKADAAALEGLGRPVLRLHFLDRLAGLVTVARAVQTL